MFCIEEYYIIIIINIYYYYIITLYFLYNNFNDFRTKNEWCWNRIFSYRPYCGGHSCVCSAHPDLRSISDNIVLCFQWGKGRSNKEWTVQRIHGYKLFINFSIANNETMNLNPFCWSSINWYWNMRYGIIILITEQTSDEKKIFYWSNTYLRALSIVKTNGWNQWKPEFQVFTFNISYTEENIMVYIVPRPLVTVQ